MISVRSLRVRLSILYVVLTMSWMSAVGVLIYLYLKQALSASRAETMVRREQRLVNYVNDVHAHLHGLSLQDQLREFMEANTTPNDIVRIYDLNGTLLYKNAWPSADVAWPDQNCTQPCLGEMTLDHHRMRTISHVTMLDGQPVKLFLAGSMDEHYDLLDHFIRSYFIAAPLMLLASIAGGLLLSRRAMEPVDRITRDARLIGNSESEEARACPEYPR
jgi:two-component system heavy metal sensor histidine kinase CusS